MVKKFGGEYELKDVEVKTSTIEAQKLFLELIWEMKPDVVIDLIRLFNFELIPIDWQNQSESEVVCTKLFLFHTQYHHYYSIDLTQIGFKPDVRHTPFLAYFDFILKNQSEFDDLMKKHEEKWKQITHNPKKKLIINSVLEELIPDWNSLKLRNDSKWLCETLVEWSEKWNLTADWCLDFALECLRICKVELIDEFQIQPNYLSINDSELLRNYYHFWREGSAWRKALGKQIWKDRNNYSIKDEIPLCPKFKYVWRQRIENKLNSIFEIERKYDPLTMLKEEFRKQVEEELWGKFFHCYQYQQHLLIGNFEVLIDKYKDFQKKLNKYISNVEANIKPFASKTISKKDGDKHFRWLIENLIQPTKYQEELAKEYKVERQAVASAITDVSRLIGLKLKQKRGRPKGVKDSSRRRRVEAN